MSTTASSTLLLPFQPSSVTSAQLAAVSYLARYSGSAHNVRLFIPRFRASTERGPPWRADRLSRRSSGAYVSAPRFELGIRALARGASGPGPGRASARRTASSPTRSSAGAKRLVLGDRAAGPGELPDAGDRIVNVAGQDQPGPRAERVGLPGQPARR